MLTLVPITTPALNFVGDVAHSLLRDGTSAFAASALATTLLHPLDTLKTRIQSQRYRVGANGAVVRTRPRRELLTDLHAHAAHAPAHPHTRQQQRERAQLQPLFADLYTGLGSNILKEAPDAAVYLALYQCLSQAGDAAGSVLRLPAEVACKRLQTGVAAGGDALQALGDVPRSDWLASWAAILARDVPLGGLQVAIYAEAQHSLHTTASAAASAAADPPPPPPPAAAPPSRRRFRRPPAASSSPPYTTTDDRAPPPPPPASARPPRRASRRASEASRFAFFAARLSADRSSRASRRTFSYAGAATGMLSSLRDE